MLISHVSNSQQAKSDMGRCKLYIQGAGAWWLLADSTTKPHLLKRQHMTQRLFTGFCL